MNMQENVYSGIGKQNFTACLLQYLASRHSMIVCGGTMN